MSRYLSAIRDGTWGTEIERSRNDNWCCWCEATYFANMPPAWSWPWEGGGPKNIFSEGILCFIEREVNDLWTSSCHVNITVVITCEDIYLTIRFAEIITAPNFTQLFWIARNGPGDCWKKLLTEEFATSRGCQTFVESIEVQCDFQMKKMTNLFHTEL